MRNKLDKELLEKLNNENIKIIFDNLIKKKTDLFDGTTRIAKGSDGIGHIQFSREMETYSETICIKGKNGKYVFAPFKEVIVPKPPFEKDQLAEAKRANKIRILSISTIQDTIFQDIISQVLGQFAEKKFHEIDNNSFAYRKNKSSKMAVKGIIKCIENGYLHVLDGDIEGFFDNIDHDVLRRKVNSFLEEQNPLIQKYLYRFMNVKRIEDGKYSKYKKNKNIAIKRNIGIPQGGVLSGLLANIFMYDFDLYVVKELTPQYKFEYFRYADDFVLLFKDDTNIRVVYDALKKYLDSEKLTLHPLGEKTKMLNLDSEKKDILDFLGFEISPKYLSVKNANVRKFKNRILNVLKKVEVKNTSKYLNSVFSNLNPKIIGLEELVSKEGYCDKCNKLLKKRSWLGYFMMINDVRLFRNLDTWIRKQIYMDYHVKTKKHLKKKDLLLLKGKLISIEGMYYRYKKQEQTVRKNGQGYCNCERYFDTANNEIVIVET